MTTLTRTDCERDNRAVSCPRSSTLGFGQRYCKRGYWVAYQLEDHTFLGRAIGRVTCEGVIYIEVAQASLAFSSAYIRWIKPEWVTEVRRAPPRLVFDFFASKEWTPETVFAALKYGVSDSRDQMAADRGEG